MVRGAELALTAALLAGPVAAQDVVVGAKNFPESRLLAEIVALALEAEGFAVERKVGLTGTLIHRAGAVALKERWPFVIGFRETPLTVIHLENLRRLAYLGATILPPVPAFYIGGEDFERFLDHYVLRVFDALGIAEPGDPGLRWPG